ncbi:helix-turn-helix transcriptional regulator [Truepera radiovictrix]|uniref:Transcriptional regulator, LuxR family n=1 Tax=Truepera radiovictrix (strain DSM 17093 / CIP 108686 / LMG 22925 / RQ-24) TaxID=649638 RepID=D7CRL1_TRURR|nr:LuxR C-terminal-related transcriptional regulator [Truepera radiovictrix]ADI13501.1 transcriptional regulator, LuxR family [Truepera radiovictrix DSM 17093]WMT57937.1 LuxR C-terminal-related transcriptional regulator [Truepera radiovictrix]
MRTRYRVLAGLEALAVGLAEGLRAFGVAIDAAARDTLLVDAPWGWAPPRLRHLCPAQMVVVSDNPCPEYRLHLLEHRPRALLHNVSIEQLAEHLQDPCLAQPSPRSSLTPAEQFTLRLLAHGRSPKQVAHHREVSEGRVKNTVSAIYQKLGLKSQAHLTLYYFGLWHVLMESGWEPPRRKRD